MNIHHFAFHGRIDGVRKEIASLPHAVNQWMELQGSDKIHRITPIFLAAIQGHLEIVQLLLDKGAVEWPDDTDHLIDWVDRCKNKKRIEVLSLLIKKKQIHEVGSRDWSFEAFKTNDEIIKSLVYQTFLEKRSPIKARNYYLILGERGDLAVIQALLGSSTPNESIMEALLEGAMRFSRIDVLKLLAASHIDLNVPFKEGRYKGNTPALFAARQSLEVVQFLFDQKIDLISPAKGKYEGVTPIYVATKHDQLEIIEFLHELGASLTDPLSSGVYRGLTLAYAAVKYNSLRAIRFLHHHGVNFETPMHVASLEGITLSCYAASLGWVEVLRLFRELSVSVNQKVKEGRFQGYTPLTYATIDGPIEVLRFFHEIGENFNEPHTEGFFQGCTMVLVAAQVGRTDVLQFLHSIQIPFNAVAKAGPFEGFSLAYMAAHQGQAETLEFLGSVGVNLSEEIKSGVHVGLTCAGAAVHLNHFEVLQVLKKFRVDLTRFAVTNGQKIDSIFQAAAAGSIKMLEFFKSEGLCTKSILSNLSGKAIVQYLKSYRQVRQLSSQEAAALLCSKIEQQPEWFNLYKTAFLDWMDQIPPEDWVKAGTWSEWNKIYQSYQTHVGEKSDWLLALCIAWINHSETGAQGKAYFSAMNIRSIEDVNPAIRPGKALLQLLEYVNASEIILRNSNLGQLNDWMSGIFRKNSNDEEFWTKAKSLFQEIHQKIPRGKKKRKKKSAQDPIKQWCDKFDQRIHDASTPQEMLDQIFQSKFNESALLYDEWIKQLSQKSSSILRTMDPSLVTIEGVEQGLGEFNLQVRQLFSHLIQNLVVLEMQSTAQQKACMEIKQRSKLVDKLDTLHSAKMARAEELHRQALEEVAKLEAGLEKTIEALKKKRDFLLLQKSMAEEVLELDFSEWEKVKNTLAEKGKKLWEERQNLVGAARNIEELHRIREQFQPQLQEVTQRLPAKQTRDQRIAEHNEEKIRKLKREKEELIRENERLKQAPVRTPSPEKKIPIAEKPVKERLIKKLKKIAFISDNAEKALRMIEQEGNILSRVSEIEKFLGLFRIEYQRTTGSHSTYTDGTHGVVIADHDGESKPAQVEDALQTVLDKLTK